MGEFKCDLHYLYSMTMAEFNIRLFSFIRQSEKQEMLTREIAYYSLIGSHVNPKKLPKSKEQFWSLPSDKVVDLDKMKALRNEILKAKENHKKLKDVR